MHADKVLFTGIPKSKGVFRKGSKEVAGRRTMKKHGYTTVSPLTILDQRSRTASP